MNSTSGSYAQSSSMITSASTLLLSNLISALTGSTNISAVGTSHMSVGGSGAWSFTPPLPLGTNMPGPVSVNGVAVHIPFDTSGNFMVIGRTSDNVNITEFIMASSRAAAKETFTRWHSESFTSIFIIREED